MGKSKVVSLFAGAGGLDVGFTQAGFETVWANDLNTDACATFERNHQPDVIRCGPLGITVGITVTVYLTPKWR